VVHGAKKGRELGFPTANIRLGDADKLLPREGVYAVYGRVGSERVPGLLHLGPRPTFRGLPPSVELHLLDWEGDLYGSEVRVEFCSLLREIRPFASAEALIEQMRRDAEAGRAALARGEGSGPACSSRGDSLT
jgi:riboflavin kinase/FMN adenylyltransferase